MTFGSMKTTLSPEILPALTTATVIGISVAIAGNILISLALNLQKLAHKRLDADKSTDSNDQYSNSHRRVDTMYEEDEDEGADSDSSSITPRPSTSNEDSESQPLVPFPQTSYGSTTHRSNLRSLMSKLSPRKGAEPVETTTIVPVEVVTEETLQNGLSNVPMRKQGNENGATQDNTSDLGSGNESEYLKSKLWWTGFLLMNVGEMGNFISYAWAPASIVAPLGTFALVANCFFAPLILGERFRKRDLLGIMIAIIGAVTVVLASNASSGRLNPDELVKAISQVPFIVYSCIYIVAIIVLSILSEGPLGQQWVLVDIGLCAFFGGFTVLSTKAVSTLLTMEWSQVFTKFITYPVILVLIVTGVGQIRYLNRALMRFDSKIVIPTQFVLFNLSAIIGSAILYGDFRKATFHQVVTFLYGCGATSLGVFIICWTAESKVDDDAEEEDQEEEPPQDSHTDSQTYPNIGSGSLGRRKVATLVLPTGVNELRTLRHKHSLPSVMGISPAQPLLLVHTPPREVPLRDIERGIDRAISTPDSISRRRALSWFGEQQPPRRPINVRNDSTNTRDSSVASRTRVAVPSRLGG